jgi:hypothetical protein
MKIVSEFMVLKVEQTYELFLEAGLVMKCLFDRKDRLG